MFLCLELVFLLVQFYWIHKLFCGLIFVHKSQKTNFIILNKLIFFWHSASRDGNFAPYFDNDLCSLPNRNSLTLSVQDVQLKMFLDSADYFFRIVLSIFKYRYIPHSKEIKLPVVIFFNRTSLF